MPLPHRPEKHRATLITVGASCVILLATWGGMYRPSRWQMRQARQELAPLLIQLTEYQEMVRREPNPDKAIEALQDRIRRFNERASRREEVPRIVQRLSQNIGTLDIELSGITPRDDLKAAGTLPEGVSKVFIEVRLRCPYQALGQYLEKLNELTALFTVEDLKIIKNPKEPTTILDVELILSTYVLA